MWWIIFSLMGWSCNHIEASQEVLVAPVILSEERKQAEELIKFLHAKCDFINDLVIQDYLIKLGKRLVEKTPLNNQERHYFIIQDEALNAFAGPAGIIGVNVGTFYILQNEGELSAILAHEIAHIMQGHLAQLARRSTTDLVATSLGLIAGTLLSTLDVDLAEGVMFGMMGGVLQARLNYSRIQEKEADQLGLKILFEAGFNPLWVARTFEHFQKISLQYHNNFSSWLSTHPIDTERISYSYNQALSYPKKSYIEDYTYNLIRVRLAFLQNRSLNTEDSKARAIEKAYYRILQKLAQKNGEGGEELTFLKDHLPNNYLILLAEAELNFNRGARDFALQQLRTLWKKDLNNRVITLKYVELLNQTQNWLKSQEVLRDALLRGKSKELLEALIKVYDHQGEKNNACFTMITLYEIEGKMSKALNLVNSMLRNYSHLSINERLKLKAKQKELIEKLLEK